MTKPKFLFVGGHAWCASSPMCYTLQRLSKYCHFGYAKSYKYLQGYMHYPRADKYQTGYLPPRNGQTNRRGSSILHLGPGTLKWRQSVINGTWENLDTLGQNEEANTILHNMNLTEDLEPLRDFSTSHFKKMMTGPPTGTKFLDFHEALYDHVSKRGFKSVGHYLPIMKKPTPYVAKFYEQLFDRFDVKEVVIVRDPIRRAWGQYLALMQISTNVQLDGMRDERNKNSYHFVPHDRVFLLPEELRVPNHMLMWQRGERIFGKGNTILIPMEELYEDDGTTKKKLSEFLNHPVNDLWTNLYAPDRGHLVPKDNRTPCQYFGQDLMELTPELYMSLKKKYQHIYDYWEEHFGRLPLYWGQPLDYHTGKPL